MDGWNGLTLLVVVVVVMMMVVVGWSTTRKKEKEVKEISLSNDEYLQGHDDPDQLLHNTIDLRAFQDRKIDVALGEQLKILVEIRCHGPEVDHGRTL